MATYQYKQTYIFESLRKGEETPQRHIICDNDYEWFFFDDDAMEATKQSLNLSSDDTLKIVWRIPNNFTLDGILSNDIIMHLNCKVDSIDIENPILVRLNGRPLPSVQEYMEAHTAYIKCIADRLDEKGREQYLKQVAQSILSNMKAAKKNTDLCCLIPSYFGISFGKQENVLSVARRIVDSNTEPKILLTLIGDNNTDDNMKELRKLMNRMGRLYNIKEESSQYRVAALVYAFAKIMGFLPTKKLRGCFSWEKAKSLICDYYNIKAPTFKDNVIGSYTTPYRGELWKSIQWEQPKFWKDLHAFRARLDNQRANRTT